MSSVAMSTVTNGTLPLAYAVPLEYPTNSPKDKNIESKLKTRGKNDVMGKERGAR